uniref:Uncharacterized protein n=1 Tax=Anguilla anguilla TaxID=7936 RepID=A0A0E9SCS1_ANGAN
MHSILSSLQPSWDNYWDSHGKLVVFSVLIIFVFQYND